MANVTLENGKVKESFLRGAPPTDVTRRMDALIFISARDCNPNGEPEEGNRPRQDQETGHGLISGPSMKRHIRDTASLLMGTEPGYAIYISRRAILDYKLLAIHEQLGISQEKKKGKKAKKEGDVAPEATSEEQEHAGKLSDDDEKKVQDLACKMYLDTRWFGAVMSSKVANSGQLRGPIQTSMARSLDPVQVIDDSLTRGAIQTEKEAKTNDRHSTFGNRPRVAFGLYRSEISFSPHFAKQTNVSADDMALFWESVARMYEYSKSSARDQIAVEQIVIFEHESFLGNAPQHKLFRLVKVAAKDAGKPARDVEDYTFSTQQEIQDKVDAAGYRGVKVHFLL